MWRVLLLVLATALIYATWSGRGGETAQVKRVIDANTLEIERDGQVMPVRLWGECGAVQGVFAIRAKDLLDKLLFKNCPDQGQVKIIPMGTDQDGNLMVRASACGKDLGLALVDEGFARVDSGHMAWYQGLRYLLGQFMVKMANNGVWGEQDAVPACP
jgi:endonuclease YncB( thermonuclease family)